VKSALKVSNCIFTKRSRSDKRSVNVISHALPFDGVWTSTTAFAYVQQREFLRSPVRRESLCPPPDGCRFEKRIRDL
jgi:hypothetical protein